MSGTLKSGAEGVSVEDEGVTDLPQVSSRLAVRHVAARIADGMRHKHMRRHVAFRPLELGEHTADVRVLDAALKQPTRLHHAVAGIVDGGGFVIDGSHPAHTFPQAWPCEGKVLMAPF